MIQQNSQNNSLKRRASQSVPERVFKKFVVVLTLLAFMLSVTVTKAEDKMRTTPVPSVTTTIPMNPLMVPLQKGWVAPFTGVLLNPPAVAQITVDSKNSKKECDIRIESEVSKEKAYGDIRLKDKDGELKYAKETLGEQIKLRDIEVNRLRKETIDKSGSAIWWSAGGFAGGVILTVTIAFLVSVSAK